MTAWFNYYLYVNTGYYAYLYGTNADSDVASGLVVRQVDTAPHGLTAAGFTGTVTLQWTLYDHPIISGYNIYRRQSGESYPETPLAHISRGAAYLDTDVVGDQVYSYTLCSYDPAGNLHKLSSQVSAIPRPGKAPHVYLPLIFKDASSLYE